MTFLRRPLAQAVVLTMLLFSGLFIAFRSILSGQSFYSPEVGVICHDRETCLHETGHMIDHEMGDISQSEEYRKSVRVYLAVLWNAPQTRDDFSRKLIDFPGVTEPTEPDNRIWTNGEWGGYSELYASMYEWAGGDIEKLPAIFRKYYEVTHDSN